MKPTLIAKEGSYALHLHMYYEDKNYPHWVITGPGIAFGDRGVDWKARGHQRRYEHTAISFGGMTREHEAKNVLKALYGAYIQGMIAEKIQEDAE